MMMEKWHSGKGRFTNLTPLFMHHLVHLARSQFKVNNSAKQNMKFMYKLFFNVLICPTAFPNSLSSDIRNVLERLDGNRISAAELIAIFDKLSAFDN